MPSCRICGGQLPDQATGRPRQYCSARCKGDAKIFARVERTIARARDRGDVEFAMERTAWLADARADARNGWADAKARVDEINRRIREYR